MQAQASRESEPPNVFILQLRVAEAAEHMLEPLHPSLRKTDEASVAILKQTTFKEGDFCSIIADETYGGFPMVKISDDLYGKFRENAWKRKQAEYHARLHDATNMPNSDVMGYVDKRFFSVLARDHANCTCFDPKNGFYTSHDAWDVAGEIRDEELDAAAGTSKERYARREREVFALIDLMQELPTKITGNGLLQQILDNALFSRATLLTITVHPSGPWDVYEAVRIYANENAIEVANKDERWEFFEEQCEYARPGKKYKKRQFMRR